MNKNMNKKINLIRKSTKSLLVTGLILTVLSSILLYFYTKTLLQEEVEEVLFSTEARIVDRLQNDKVQYSLPPIVEIKEVEFLKSIILKDTIIFDPSQEEMELFRELSTYKTINNNNYQITVRNLVVESEDILIAIVLSYLIIFLFCFLFLFYFNKKNNIKLWSPFFKNLEQMKNFSISSKKPIELIESDVLEFSDLKKQIENLTSKVSRDYENLKQFTENVSHELQTPLSIIQAKIDTIINDFSINEKQYERITSIQKDIQRLKHLNKRITILTKIDNHQYLNNENINFENLIKNKLDNFKDMGVNNIMFILNKKLIVSMDSFLAEILINNLISNAIKHNSDDGKILIVVNDNSLIISNSGKSAINHQEKIFYRFYKENNSQQSTGLGLALVKKICDYYNFELNYNYKENQHFFSVNFS